MGLDDDPKYKLTHAAKMDLGNIYWYGYENYGKARADAYIESLFQRFEEIAVSPNRYPAVDYIRLGYRRSVCRNLSIYYKVACGKVAIMRVIGRQDKL